MSGTETGSPTDVDPGPVEAEILSEDQVIDTSAADVSLEEPAIEAIAEPIEDGDVHADTELTAEDASASTVPAAPIVAGALDRAHALLDELKALLPNLPGADGELTSTDTIANELAAAQSPPSDRESFAELRSAIDGARGRPRDIDTMLDVSGRLDAIASLHDAYERLSLAVDGVVKRFRPSSVEESATDDSDRPASA